MNKIIIITPSLYDFTEDKYRIGGLETYIKDLARLSVSLNLDCIVYQLTNKECNFLNATIDGVKIQEFNIKGNLLNFAHQRTFDAIYQKENKKGCKFIIATDQLDIKSSKNNVIKIQHGIAFDIPGEFIKGFWGKTRLLQFINKLLRCIKNVDRFSHTKHTICVDYNYYNWFRTLGTIRAPYTIDVIPNYASKSLTKEELDLKLRKATPKRIVFARRFVDYRGTLLFAEVTKNIIKKYSDIEVTFAGNGPLEDKLKSMFQNQKQVSFTSFSASESIEFHSEYDIAVIPTIYSEGTSLSLAEAMSAGCVPIATHVGGMTNMILDRFNGMLVYPSVKSLEVAIEYLLNLNNDEFKKMSINAWNTCQSTFSYKHWSKQWTEILVQDENDL